jgi:hypothetical protein
MKLMWPRARCCSVVNPLMGMPITLFDHQVSVISYRWRMSKYSLRIAHGRVLVKMFVTLGGLMIMTAVLVGQ